ncbi:MAG TPA: hypothetical protein VER58_19070 [Thermoanaerobaculia bacterium]|nr:hypothetical protein [Thermoanaerobaculia bacterium]
MDERDLKVHYEEGLLTISGERISSRKTPAIITASTAVTVDSSS